MGFFKSTKKILALANNTCIVASWCSDCNRGRIGSSAIYLYSFLMDSNKDTNSKLVIVTGFLALSYVFHAQILSHISLALALIFLSSDLLSKGILWVWWKIAHVLGWLNTRILLTVVFYVVLLPFAFLSRIFSKDPLSLKWKKSHSFFVERNHKYQASDLDNPW